MLSALWLILFPRVCWRSALLGVAKLMFIVLVAAIAWGVVLGSLWALWRLFTAVVEVGIV